MVPVSAAPAKATLLDQAGPVGNAHVADDQGLPELAVVVPVYRCAQCLECLHRRLSETLRDLVACYRIVYVEDCSPDESWEYLRRLGARDHRVVAHRLTDNVGQVMAIIAGLTLAEARWFVVMDCDLQHPPELIGPMLDRARQGHDIVMAAFDTRDDSMPRRLGSALYFWWFRRIGGHPMAGRCGPFSVLSRRARDRYLALAQRHRAYGLNVLRLPLPVAMVHCHKPARQAGTSSYTLRKLVRRGLEGTALVRWPIHILGFAVLSLALSVAVFGWTYRETGSVPTMTMAGSAVFLVTGIGQILYEAWLRRTAARLWRLAESIGDYSQDAARHR